MQRHRQHHHGRAPQLAFRPLRLVAPHMKVGNQTIQHEQKQHADPKADQGGKEGQPAHPLRLLNRGNQQTPNRRRHHHPCGKARKRALHQIAKRFFHKEHARRAQRRSEKRNQDSEKGFQISSPPFRCIRFSPLSGRQTIPCLSHFQSSRSHTCALTDFSGWKPSHRAA